MMKKLLLFFGIFTSLFAFFGKEDLYLYWMSGNSSPKFLKIIKSVRQSLRSDYNVHFKIIKNYESLYSVIENPDYYTDNQKLMDGLNADSRINKNGYYVIFRFITRDGYFYIKGVKFKKEGLKGLALRENLKKQLSGITAQTIANMLYFYVKSSLYNYKGIQRKGISPIILNSYGKYYVYLFKPKKVIYFTDTVTSDDIDLVKTLHLFTYKNQADFARKYCSFLDMFLPNKKYVDAGKEHYFEEYYIQDGFEDGYMIYKKYLPDTDKEFRCMGNDGSFYKETLEDYELNKIGIYWKIKVDSLLAKGNIISYNEKNKNVNIKLMAKDGTVYTFKNNSLSDRYYVQPVPFYINHLVGYNFYFKKTDNAYIDINQNLYIHGKKVNLGFKASTFHQSGNFYFAGGKNGQLVKIYANYNTVQIRKKYQPLSGSIVKIINLNLNTIGVITDKGEFAVYNINKSDPLKTITQNGYPYVDIVSKGKWVLLVNENGRAYLILKNILLKGKK